MTYQQIKDLIDRKHKVRDEIRILSEEDYKIIEEEIDDSEMVGEITSEETWRLADLLEQHNN